MKALVKATEAVGYEYKDIDMPRVGPKDVVVKIMGTAICGSDIHAYHSSPNIMKMMQLPIVTGCTQNDIGHNLAATTTEKDGAKGHGHGNDDENKATGSHGNKRRLFQCCQVETPVGNGKYGGHESADASSLSGGCDAEKDYSQHRQDENSDR